MDYSAYPNQKMATEAARLIQSVVEDEIIAIDAPEAKGWTKPDTEAITALFRQYEDVVKKTFVNNDYLKLDVTHGEILGLHSTSMIGDTVLPDLPVMDHAIRSNPKYRDADIWNIANVEALYK